MHRYCLFATKNTLIYLLIYLLTTIDQRLNLTFPIYLYNVRNSKTMPSLRGIWRVHNAVSTAAACWLRFVASLPPVISQCYDMRHRAHSYVLPNVTVIHIKNLLLIIVCLKTCNHCYAIRTDALSRPSGCRDCKVGSDWLLCTV